MMYRGPHPGTVRGGANVSIERRTDSPQQQQQYMEQPQVIVGFYRPSRVACGIANLAWPHALRGPTIFLY